MPVMLPGNGALPAKWGIIAGNVPEVGALPAPRALQRLVRGAGTVIAREMSMKQIVIFLVALAATMSCGTQKSVETIGNSFPVQETLTDVSPDKLIIMYDEEIGKEPLLKAVEAYGAELIYDYSIIPGIAIRIPEGKDIRDAINYFKKVQGVTSVERDHIYHLTDPVQPKLEVM